MVPTPGNIAKMGLYTSNKCANRPQPDKKHQSNDEVKNAKHIFS
jgi:hypothetical protein